MGERRCWGEKAMYMFWKVMDWRPYVAAQFPYQLGRSIPGFTPTQSLNVTAPQLIADIIKTDKVVPINREDNPLNRYIF